jgi:hypothetical protein
MALCLIAVTVWSSYLCCQMWKGKLWRDPAVPIFVIVPSDRCAGWHFTKNLRTVSYKATRKSCDVCCRLQWIPLATFQGPLLLHRPLETPSEYPDCLQCKYLPAWRYCDSNDLINTITDLPFTFYSGCLLGASGPRSTRYGYSG